MENKHYGNRSRRTDGGQSFVITLADFLSRNLAELSLIHMAIAIVDCAGGGAAS